MILLQDIRFRVEGKTLVLQVLQGPSYDSGNFTHAYGGASYREPDWRDAQPEDMLNIARLLNDQYARAK